MEVGTNIEVDALLVNGQRGLLAETRHWPRLCDECLATFVYCAVQKGHVAFVLGVQRATGRRDAQRAPRLGERETAAAYWHSFIPRRVSTSRAGHTQTCRSPDEQFGGLKVICRRPGSLDHIRWVALMCIPLVPRAHKSPQRHIDRFSRFAGLAGMPNRTPETERR